LVALGATYIALHVTAAWAQSSGQVAPVPVQPSSQTAPTTPVQASPVPSVPAGVPLPTDYVIGPDDVLTVVFWRDKDMTTDVVVRSDGRITLPLVNDLSAGGLTPEQLRVAITQSASKYIEDPTVSVVVKQINSRKVFITGQVGKPGAYSLGGPMTVLQLISLAGGLNEFAKQKDIVITRQDGGRQTTLKFNYRDVLKGKNLQQNVELKVGDTVLVP
jgi:polysaccharide export outer membrane protein